MTEMRASERTRFVATTALSFALAAVHTSPLAAQQPPAADSLHIRVLAIHDAHGALRPVPGSAARGEVGGAAALKAHMDSAAARCACPVFRLDSGDQLHGSLESNLSYGAAMVAALNAVGIDAAAVGNHDLGWGVDTLLARQAQARYPWLAANVFLRGTDERPAWARPYALLERDGVRVAVIGYVTTETPDLLHPAKTAAYEFRAALDGVSGALAAVRPYAPDFTVIVAHARGYCSGGDCRGEVVELAQALDPDEVHLIASGHEHHAAIADVVNGIPIVRAGSHMIFMSVVDLIRTPSGERRFVLGRDTLWVDEVEPDATVEAALRPYLARADSVAGATIATLSESFLAHITEHLGNLISDAMRRAAGTDIALNNTGGIRASLREGAVTYNDAYRVLPFDNALVRVRVSGLQLRRIAEVAVGERRPDDFSGMVVDYDTAQPPGSRVLSMVLDDGTPIEDARSYTLVVPEYIADGGGGYALFTELPTERLDIPMLDAFIEHLRTLPQPIVAPAEPRARPRSPSGESPPLETLRTPLTPFDAPGGARPRVSFAPAGVQLRLPMSSLIPLPLVRI